jgi:hypothetical protein
MTCKNAPAGTWSFAPTISLQLFTWHPYDTIVQFIGSYVRQLTLDNPRDEAKIIEHLAVHSSHLDQLFLRSATTITSINVDRSHLAVVFSRLTRLTIQIAPLFEPFVFFSRLEDVFKGSSLRMALEHLVISCGPTTLEEKEMFGRTLSRFAATLTFVSVPLTISPDEAATLFSQCESLKRFEGLNLSHPMTANGWDDFAMRFFRALASTRVGTDVFVTENWLDNSLLANWLINTDQSGVSLVQRLEESGFDMMISPECCAHILNGHCLKPSKWHIEEFLDLLEAQSSPILPPTDSIKLELASSQFWKIAVVRQLDTTTLDRCVRMFGSPSMNLFPYVTREHQVLWLLRSISKEQALEHLAETQHLRLSPSVSHLLARNLVEIVAAGLGDCSFLAMTGIQAFMQFLDAIRKDNDELLRLAVKATGWKNITPEMRGAALWKLCIGSGTSEDGQPTLFYWIDLISADPLPGVAFLATESACTLAARAFETYTSCPYPCMGLMEVIWRLKEQFLPQFELCALELQLFLFQKLIAYIACFQDKHFSRGESLSTYVYGPLGKMHSRSGSFSTATALKTILQSPKPHRRLCEMLLKLADEADRMTYDLDNQNKCSGQVAGILRSTFPKRWGAISVACLDYVNVNDLNFFDDRLHFNLVDCALMRSKFQSSFDTIGRIVRQGGRASPRGLRNTKQLDKESFEFYSQLVDSIETGQEKDACNT